LSRIESTFRRLSRVNEAALIPYVIAGYPSLEITRTLLPVMARQGVDLILLGVPSVEPLYGGGTMLRASYKAQKGTSEATLALAEEARRTNEIPLVLVVDSAKSLDPSSDLREIIDAVAASGVDGLMIEHGLPPETIEHQMRLCEQAGIDFILPVPQTGMNKHLQVMVETASGFIYCLTPRLAKEIVSQLLEETAALVSEVREHTVLPVVVDSHLGTPEHVAEASGFADGVVVSSSLTNVIDTLEGDDIIPGVSDYLRSLKEATHR
jgi:tryptophan synthase alpha chain